MNRTHLGSGELSDKKSGTVEAISFCFVAKVPREITAVSRTTKYTTAMMQWNKREHPFCFGGVGASILNRKSSELLKRIPTVFCFVLLGEQEFTDHPPGSNNCERRRYR